MGKTLRKIIGATLVIEGTILAVNAYHALFNRISEIKNEVRTQDYPPRIELRDCFIGESGLTYGALGVLAGLYCLSDAKRR